MHVSILCVGWTRTNHSFDGFLHGIVVSCFLTAAPAFKLPDSRRRLRSNGSGAAVGAFGSEMLVAAWLRSRASTVDTRFFFDIVLQKDDVVQAAVCTGGFFYFCCSSPVTFEV